MAITVAVISPSLDQRRHVTRAIGEMPDLFVVHQADDLQALRELPAIPQVVLIGVPVLADQQASDRFWKALAWVRKTAPGTRLAVWFAEAEVGATADLRANGVAGIVQWSDAKDDLWPRLVRAIFAGSQFWSRPFDSLEHRAAQSPIEPPHTRS